MRVIKRTAKKLWYRFRIAEAKLKRRHQRLPRLRWLLMAGVMILSVVTPTLTILLDTKAYALSPEARALVGTPNSNLTKKLSYDTKQKAWLFNNTEKPLDASQAEELLRAQVGGGGANDTTLYSAKLPADARQGITYTDNATSLSFTLKPQFKKGQGKLVDNRLIYPMADGAKAVYTIKANGLKEDIILDKAIGDELTYSYTLDLPKDLEAKRQANGSIGVFSADPTLYTAKTSSDIDAATLRGARAAAKKDYLAFGLPAPVIIDSKGKQVPGTFSLAGNTLTVHARGLAKLSYPLTIDPSVVITSSSDFGAGTGDGMIDFTSADQIKRSALTGGSVGSWSTSTSFTSVLSARSHYGGTQYNGYTYVIGGFDNIAQSDSAYAPINSNGTIGSWTATTSLPEVRTAMTAIAHNGYMYVLGGTDGSGTFYTSVRYAPINSNGSLGSWSSANSFTGDRGAAAAVIYGNYIYIIGGEYNWYESIRDDIQYAAIKSDGSLGSWSTTTALPSGRSNMGTFTYNGYLYVIGGNNTSGTIFNQVLRAPIKSDGTLGSWITEGNLPVQNSPGLNSVTFGNGYVYLVGGYTGSYVNTVYYAPVKADGSIGSWRTTTPFSTGRLPGSIMVYNQYLYIIGGGEHGETAPHYGDVQYAKINDAGATSPYSTSGNTFTTNRRGGQAVVYNGYLYVMGGDAGGAPVATIFRATISDDGTIGSFTASGSFTTNRTYFAAVAYNGYMYVMGGCSSAYSSCTTAGNNLNTVYRASIDANGAIGTWTNASMQVLPAARYGIAAVAYNGYMYVMGGLNASTFSNAIYYHAIASDGSMSGAWSTSTRTLPANMAYMKATAYGGRLYVAGGCSAGALTCTTTRNTVHYTGFDTNGELSSTLTASGTFTTNRGDFGFTAVNGRLYLAGGRTNTTYYGDTQSAAINSDGTVGSWSAISGATLATNRYGIGMTSTNGNLYVTGGYNGSTYYNNVQIAQVNNGGGGGTSSWTIDTTDTFTTARTEAQTVTYNGYLYVLGGYISGGTNLNTVQYAPLNTNGTVGGWTATSSFTNARRTFSAAVLNGYMYILGGHTGSGTHYKDIQYAKINGDGSLGSWAAAGSNVSNGGQGVCMVAAGGYIYSLGGWDGSTDFNTVRYAVQNANGTIGAWQNGNSFTTGRSNLNCTAYGNYLYLSGGETNVGLNDVQYATINPANGSIGAWTYTTSFHLGRANHAMVAYNGFMYIAGGVDSTSTNNARGDMQYAPINANGTVGEWRHITATLSNSDYLDIVATNGYLYAPSQVMGDTSTGYTAPNTIARKGTFSKRIDTGMLGRIVGIGYGGTLPGGAVQISYRTAEEDGVFGDLKSAQFPGFAEACIGAFGNARYVWLTVSLDDATSGTFGDSNPATLTDITVTYSPIHPEVEYRLGGGKTLISGNLSPLDTCG